MRRRQEQRVVAEVARGQAEPDDLARRAGVAPRQKVGATLDHVARVRHERDAFVERARVVLARRPARDDSADAALQLVLDDARQRLEIDLALVIERCHDRRVHALEQHSSVLPGFSPVTS